MDRLGVRELRIQTAAAVRRAGAGERIVITVDGRPVAQLGPIDAGAAAPTLDDLAARGLVHLPRRADRAVPEDAVEVWAGFRLDRLLPRHPVTLFLDSSGLVARHVAFPGRAVVLDACAADTDWCASALALTESLVLAERLSDDTAERDALRRALRVDWERLAVVPVDRLCLDRAAELAAGHPVRVVDAVHLAAADRLPRPVIYATFDDHQIPVALALGFEVVSA